MPRTYIKELGSKIGEEVTIKGWVDIRRDQGKLIFLDFRDMTGVVQGVILPNATEAHGVGEKLRPEWVVEVNGKVNERPERNRKAGVLNGNIELEILKINILNEALTPPIDVRGDGYEIGEDVRLTNRYLDLRRPRLQKNIRNRSKVMTFVRNFFTKEDFAEIETPTLTIATAEGSRDFLVPSRLERGAFYALPQSPQQYKQLLMAADMEKYFQFARCYRDEDSRGDRQPEFTQMDLEMSFVNRDDVMEVNERALIALVKELYPHKKIQQIPFPRLTYKEVMEKYGSDKPDIREDKNDKDLLAFCWVIDFPFFEKDDKGGWTFSHNPFSSPTPECMADLMNKTNIEKIITTQYDIALNGYELGGGSIRNHKPDALRKALEIMGFSDEKIEKEYGHMLKSFSFGIPPHGGIAWGFDRLMMLLEGEPNIREVIAFAKNGEGRDLMIGAPAKVSGEQLLELGVNIIKKEDKK